MTSLDNALLHLCITLERHGNETNFSTPRIIDSGESIFDYEYFSEFDAKIAKALTVI